MLPNATAQAFQQHAPLQQRDLLRAQRDGAARHLHHASTTQREKHRQQQAEAAGTVGLKFRRAVGRGWPDGRRSQVQAAGTRSAATAVAVTQCALFVYVVVCEQQLLGFAGQKPAAAISSLTAG